METWFVIYTNETERQQELYGPFSSDEEALDWATARQDEGWSGKFDLHQLLDPSLVPRHEGKV
jgi:hypothetical protein